MRRYFRKQLQTLPCNRDFQIDKASEIPAWAGQARDESRADRVGDRHEHDRDRLRLPLYRSGHGGRACDNHIGLQVDQFFREHLHPLGAAGGPTNVDPHIAAIGPTQLRKPARQPGRIGLRLRIVFIELDKHADPAHPIVLLRARRERPNCRSTA
jgi:hypothetical protein